MYSSFYILLDTYSLDQVEKVLGVTKSWHQVQLDFWISLPMYFNKITLTFVKMFSFFKIFLQMNDGKLTKFE